MNSHLAQAMVLIALMLTVLGWHIADQAFKLANAPCTKITIVNADSASFLRPPFQACTVFNVRFKE